MANPAPASTPARPVPTTAAVADPKAAAKLKKESERKALAEKVKAMSPDEKKQYRAGVKLKAFKTGAAAQVNRILAAADKLSRIAKNSRGVFDDEQAKKITTALEAALENVKARLDTTNGGKESGFTL